MLALLYRVPQCGLFIVSTSRELALEQAKEYSDEEEPEIEYMGRVVNLSLGDHETTKEDQLRLDCKTLPEVTTNNDD